MFVPLQGQIFTTVCLETESHCYMSTFFAQGLVISNSTSMYMVWLQKYCWYRKYRLMNNELQFFFTPPPKNKNK